MTKRFLFALATILSSAYCQIERAGLGGGRATGDAVLDGGIRPGSGSGLDGATRRPGDGSGAAADGAVADGAGTGGASGAPAAGSTGGNVATADGPRTGGAISQDAVTHDELPSTGGAPAATSPDGNTTPDGANAADAAVAPADAPVSAPRDAASSATRLVWADEFDGEANSRADTTTWTYVSWSPGKMNNEKQQYTTKVKNAFLDGRGNLVIRALHDEDEKYTSARLDTKGKFSFRTGRVEVRAMLPAGRGSAPGITLVGISGSWPDSGALALMEQGGQDKSWFYATAYAGGASGDTGHVRYDFKNATTASVDFHVYSLDWRADSLVFQVDGNTVSRTSYDPTSPFASIPESVVLYLAMGGDMGGSVDTKAFPMDMVIDYVRVYAF